MDVTLIFRLLAAAAVLLAMVIAGTYRRRATAGESFSIEDEGLAIAVPLRLGGLLVWLYAPALALFPEALAWTTFDGLPVWLRAVAAGMALLIVPPFIVWAQRSLGRSVSPTVVIRDGHRLVTEGPYRYIRHPLYTAGLVFFVSLAVMTESWFLLAALAVMFGVLLLRVPKEEANLLRAYGDEYRRYRQRTGRFLPRLNPERS